jgi:O-antigen/teichoic acid export membrane protein
MFFSAWRWRTAAPLRPTRTAGTTPVSDALHAPVNSAGLMVGGRLVNMVVGLLMIPVLILNLGGTGFAAWAILLALAAGFSLLEIGMGPTMVRFLALSTGSAGAVGDASRLFGRMWQLLAMTFGVGAVALVAAAQPLANWLGLPATPLFSAADAIGWVYAAVAARALLQSGTLCLFATHRFAAASAVSLLQPLCSNVAGMLAAWQTHRLDIALIAYWLVQLTVLGVTFYLNRRLCMPRFGAATSATPGLRELGYYGVTNQVEGWAQFINFQFDKFIVAGLLGLWAVAPYEVANRAVAALRSIPASSAETFLPMAVARHHDRAQAWQWYLTGTRIAIYGVCIFMLAPLAVAPVFLYAWAGDIGYVGRWAFVALCIGAMASVLALPAATMAQASGHPELQARAAAITILLNVPLSLSLVYRWGLVGASIGTAIAMLSGAALLVLAVHRHMARPVNATLRLLASFWPPLLVCAAWGVLTYSVFYDWFQGLEAATRFSRHMRMYPGLLAGVVYGLCLGTVLWVEVRRGAFTAPERAFVARLVPFKGWRAFKLR